MLNRPWDAGDISKISRAVMACSTIISLSWRGEKYPDDRRRYLPNPLEPACIRDINVKLLSYTVELVCQHASHDLTCQVALGWPTCMRWTHYDTVHSTQYPSLCLSRWYATQAACSSANARLRLVSLHLQGTIPVTSPG